MLSSTTLRVTRCDKVILYNCLAAQITAIIYRFINVWSKTVGRFPRHYEKDYAESGYATESLGAIV